MKKLDFIKKLYNGKNCYSDHMTEEELNLLHIPSKVEGIISDMLKKRKIVFLTGNPGDGKTFIIKALNNTVVETNAYVQRDMNSSEGYLKTAQEIVACFNEQRPAIIAVNEYPFIKLCQELKKLSSEIVEEILAVKRSAITYDISFPLKGRIALIDLNERNLLDSDRHLIGGLIDKFIELISEESDYNAILKYNIKALSVPEIKKQVVEIMSIVATECEHFAVRDVLGAFAYMFTACITDDHESERYYSAIFNSSNCLLQAVQKFDPIFLSLPTLDEALWNGEVTEGWIFDMPNKWPNAAEYDDDIEGAVACFKEIKRKYYFENIQGQKLLSLQPDEIKKCKDIFTSFNSQKKKIKERIIKSVNKLFLPSSNDKKQLHIWTTHRFDMSIPAAVAISRKSIDSSELDIQMPRPADWINGIEYIPDHIILKPRGRTEPILRLDIDFLRTLNAVDEGYPIGLLAPKYEQTAAIFLQQLDDNGLTEENEDGETIIASRKRNYKKHVYIQDGKYSFEED